MQNRPSSLRAMAALPSPSPDNHTSTSLIDISFIHRFFGSYWECPTAFFNSLEPIDRPHARNLSAAQYQATSLLPRFDPPKGQLFQRPQPFPCPSPRPPVHCLRWNRGDCGFPRASANHSKPPKSSLALAPALPQIAE